MNSADQLKQRAIATAVARVQRAAVKSGSTHVDSLVTEFREWAIGMAQIATHIERARPLIEDAEAQVRDLQLRIREAQASIDKCENSFHENARDGESRVTEVDIDVELRQEYLRTMRLLTHQLQVGFAKAKGA